ncbi:MAG: hypothetical protein PVI90_00575 [Desulfobacteraceae bacterium]|jgi:hypothetical protein
MDDTTFDIILQTAIQEINTTDEAYIIKMQSIAKELQQRFINPFCRKHEVKFVSAEGWFMFFKGKSVIDSHTFYPAEITRAAWTKPPKDYDKVYRLLTLKCYKSSLFEHMENYNGEE